MPWPLILKKLGNIMQILSAIATLLGFAYLLVDLRFQSAPSVSSSASDPLNPFQFPFIVINNSHFLGVYRVNWACRIDTMEIGNNIIENVSMDHPSGEANSIAPGDTLNLDCSHAVQFDVTKLRKVRFEIELSYTFYFGGVIRWRVEHVRTPFIWYGTASNPQWVKGHFAQ